MVQNGHTSNDEPKPSDGNLEKYILLSINEAEEYEKKRRRKIRKFCNEYQAEAQMGGVILLAIYTIITLALWSSQQTANSISQMNFSVQNRPWLRFDESAIWLGTPSTSGKGDLHIVAQITLENVGLSPALYTNVGMSTIAADGVAPVSAAANKCKEMRASTARLGLTVFPGKQPPWRMIIDPIGQDARVMKTPIFYIIGCITYILPSDRHPHSTEFVWTILKKDGRIFSGLADLIANPGDIAVYAQSPGNDAD